MFKDFKKVLVIAPHADDGELGCGGTIARLIEEKKEVFHLAFSLAEKVGNENEVRKPELIKSAQILRIKNKNLIFYNYPLRYFSDYSHEIRDILYKINQKIKPDIVFLPSRNDVHQDHKVIFEEVLRIFKHNTLLSYAFPWNNYNFSSQLFIELKPKHIQAKIRALSCYKSQKSKAFIEDDFILSFAKLRGVQAGTKFAESFEVLRIISRL